MADLFVTLVRLAVWIVVTAAWAAVGFILWVPFLARVIAVYTAVVITSTLTGADLGRSEAALHTAISFYSEGFRRIFRLARHDGTVTEFKGTSINLVHFLLAVVHTLYSIAFWLGVLWTLGIRLPVRFPQLATAASLTHDEARELPGTWLDAGLADQARPFQFAAPSYLRMLAATPTRRAGTWQRRVESGQWAVRAETLWLVRGQGSQARAFKYRYAIKGDTLVLSDGGLRSLLAWSSSDIDQLLAVK